MNLWLGRFASFVLMLIAIPLFVMAACSASFETALLSPATYESALSNEFVADNVIPLALPAIIEIVDANDELLIRSEIPVDLRDLSDALTLEDWRVVTQQLAPSEWLQAQTTQIINILLSILSGNLDVLEQRIDVAELRERLRGEAADEAARTIIENAPRCSRTQIDRIRTIESGRSAVLPVCEPPAEYVDLSVTVITDWLGNVADLLGDDAPTVQTVLGVTNDDVRVVGLLVDIDNQLLAISYLCPAALLALVVMFAVRSLKGFGRWLGWASIVISVALVAVIFLLQTFLLGAAGDLITEPSEIERFRAQVVFGIIRAAVEGATAIMLGHVFVFGVIGFALMVVGTLAPQPNVAQGGNTVLVTPDGQVISTASTRNKRLIEVPVPDEDPRRS